MRAGRAVAGGDDGVKGLILGAFGEQGLDQGLLDLLFGLAEPDSRRACCSSARSEISMAAFSAAISAGVLIIRRPGNRGLAVDDLQIGLRRFQA